MINDSLFGRDLLLSLLISAKRKLGRNMEFSYKSEFILMVENEHLRMFCCCCSVWSVRDIVRKIVKTCFAPLV